MRRLRLLLDANVLVDAQVRDLFCRMCERGLVDLRWSNEILQETRRALVDRMGVRQESADRLLGALQTAFPGASVTGHGSRSDALQLPDPDDRHVLGAALHDECDLLVTNNTKDFPLASLPADADLLVLDADEAIVYLSTLFGPHMQVVVERQIRPLRNPPMTIDQYLVRLSEGAPLGSVVLGAAMGIEEYETMLAQMQDVMLPTSAHGTVKVLLDALADGVGLLPVVVGSDLTADLTSSPSPSDEELRAGLMARIGDVVRDTAGWGLATARRPHAPDRELVKVVWTGSADVEIVREVRTTVAHIFELEWRNNMWVLVGLDDPDPALAEDV